ncbi:STAS domain-containing protein [Streptomyces libani]
MTAPPSDDRRATIATPDRHTAHLHLSGDLGHTTADELLALAVRQIAAQPGLRDLHLNCAQVRACDPMGLSVLLALHRRDPSPSRRPPARAGPPSDGHRHPRPPHLPAGTEQFHYGLTRATTERRLLPKGVGS